jgi:hypothetical protein
MVAAGLVKRRYTDIRLHGVTSGDSDISWLDAYVNGVSIGTAVVGVKCIWSGRVFSFRQEAFIRTGRLKIWVLTVQYQGLLLLDIRAGALCKQRDHTCLRDTQHEIQKFGNSVYYVKNRAGSFSFFVRESVLRVSRKGSDVSIQLTGCIANDGKAATWKIWVCLGWGH